MDVFPECGAGEMGVQWMGRTGERRSFWEKREEKERGDKEGDGRKRARPMRAGPFSRCEEFMG